MWNHCKSRESGSGSEGGDVTVGLNDLIADIGEDVVDEGLLGSGDLVAGHEHDGTLNLVFTADDVLFIGFHTVDLHGKENLLVGIGLVVGAETGIADAPGIAGDIGGQLRHGSGLCGGCGNFA